MGKTKASSSDAFVSTVIVAAWKDELPEDVGLIVIDSATTDKSTVVKAKYRDIPQESKDMLKNSLIRTLFYQNQKENWYLRKDT